MRRTALAALAATLVALVACAGAGHGDSVATSGIRGRAVVGPTCPVEVSETPCPDRPLDATLEVVGASGEVVTTVRTGKDGRFEVAVSPGRYVLRARRSASPLPSLKETEVEVSPHRYTSVVLHFDSGIR